MCSLCQLSVTGRQLVMLTSPSTAIMITFGVFSSHAKIIAIRQLITWFSSSSGKSRHLPWQLQYRWNILTCVCSCSMWTCRFHDLEVEQLICINTSPHAVKILTEWIPWLLRTLSPPRLCNKLLTVWISFVYYWFIDLLFL